MVSYAPLRAKGGHAPTGHRSALPIKLMVVVGLCLLLFFFQLFVVFFQIVMAPADRFSNVVRTVYTTCISILATILAVYITTEIRVAFLRHLDFRLGGEGYSSLDRLDRLWKEHLGLLTLRERLRFSTWPTQLLYITAGLLATAVLSAVTPSNGTISTPYTPSIPVGDANDCASLAVDTTTFGDAWWNVTGTNLPYGATGIGSECPAYTLDILVSSLNGETPQQFAYSDGATLIHGSAAGVPRILYSQTHDLTSDDGVSDVIAYLGSNLQSLEQCAPVLASNPVTCRHDPNPTVSLRNDEYGFCGFNVTSMGCVGYNNLTASCESLDLETSLTGNICAKKTDVGAGNMFIALTDVNAARLALTVGDVDWIKDNYDPTQPKKNLTYVVNCEIDVGKAIQWRNVNFNLQGSHGSGGALGQIVTATDSCQPAGELGNAYSVMAATGLGYALTEYWDTIEVLASNQSVVDLDAKSGTNVLNPNALIPRGGPYGFNNSKNALEDVMGLIGAVVMSRMPHTNTTQQSCGLPGCGNFSLDTYEAVNNPLPMIDLSGEMIISIIRVGPGSHFAVIYAIPSLVIAGVALYLLWVVPRQQEEYRSTAMKELIALGRAMERQMREAEDRTLPIVSVQPQRKSVGSPPAAARGYNQDTAYVSPTAALSPTTQANDRNTSLTTEAHGYVSPITHSHSYASSVDQGWGASAAENERDLASPTREQRQTWTHISYR